jgi:prevent-host-death family protein
MERIGVRELRQHASRYLARVRAGETIEVTDRGRLVARLVPVREESWQDLIDAGVVIPAEDPAVDLATIDLGPPVTDGPSLSQILEQLRDEERS